ncbi:Amino Acid-Polyamine-Organocation (APC) Family [Achlya hypogyna]|uniref:Amino Acid-Polyamine-Organocation (APC) Family n=1 Tax=Achlya hypogyna TaxID=1202772 RepID=A0A1V9ZL46_ACHHY|nr:Amino Acid-Polyamine-Organocation (APC) Family [Achlya hypogyna]
MEAQRGPALVDSVLIKASALDIWCLGIAMVIGGQCFSWNAGLVAGVASNAAAIIVVGLAYVCLVLSMAEMTSTLPFAGGAYGLSRCCLGYFSGFVIGCCEALEYIAYVSSSVLMLGQMLQIVFPAITDALLPVAWLVIYVVAVVIHIRGGQIFWNVNRVLSLVSLVVLAVYVVGSLPAVSFTTYANPILVNGFSEFFTTMPLAAWFFVGIESLNTLSSGIEDPKRVIPKGQIPCVVTLFVCAVAVFFVAVSLPPGAGALTTVVAVLSPGFMYMFHVSSEIATLFSLPATFATVFGFILAYANILAALANSKLLPVWIGRKHPVYHTQMNGLIVGSVIGYIVCFAVNHSARLGRALYSICMFFGFSAYLAQCAGYLYLKHEFSHLPRQFKSPLGKYGIYYSSLVWILNWISILTSQEDQGFIVGVIACILFVLTVYYYCYAKSRQSISDDERKILLFVHVAKKAELTKRGGRGDISVTQAIQSGYNQMISWLLQPPRKLYALTALGPATFFLGNRAVTRTDFKVVCHSSATKEPYSVQCYLWQALAEAPIVIYMHSNMGSAVNALPIRDKCLEAGFSFAAFDFGGCGLSTGPYVTGGYEERAQLSAVLDTLATMTEGSSRPVFLWGHSLGAATALELLGRGTTHPISGLVLDSPYTSLADMIQSCFENAKSQGIYLPGFVLWMTMALARKSISAKAGFALDEVNPLKSSKSCSVPALFFNGSHDLYVSPTTASRFDDVYGGTATRLTFDGDHYGDRPVGVEKSAITFLRDLVKANEH